MRDQKMDNALLEMLRALSNHPVDQEAYEQAYELFSKIAGIENFESHPNKAALLGLVQAYEAAKGPLPERTDSTNEDPLLEAVTIHLPPEMARLIDDHRRENSFATHPKTIMALLASHPAIYPKLEAMALELAKKGSSPQASR